MKMKNCELCKGLARMHCESDRASLCWSCDYKVHSANFLVARHSRTLLCQVCQSPTSWTATGLKLGPTVSLCGSCVQNYDEINNEESEAKSGDEEIETEMESDNFDDDAEDDDEDEEYDCEEDTDSEDNQVVPWSPSTPPPPSTANSPSNSGEESYSSSFMSSPCNQRETQRKRTRENSDRCYNVNCVSASSLVNADAPLATTVAVLEAAVKHSSGADRGRPDSVDSLSTMVEKSLKKRRLKMGRSRIPGSRSWAVVESIKRLQHEQMTSSTAMAELRRLGEDSSVVDYDSSDSA